MNALLATTLVLCASIVGDWQAVTDEAKYHVPTTPPNAIAREIFSNCCLTTFVNDPNGTYLYFLLDKPMAEEPSKTDKEWQYYVDDRKSGWMYKRIDKYSVVYWKAKSFRNKLFDSIEDLKKEQSPVPVSQNYGVQTSLLNNSSGYSNSEGNTSTIEQPPCPPFGPCPNPRNPSPSLPNLPTPVVKVEHEISTEQACMFGGGALLLAILFVVIAKSKRA